MNYREYKQQVIEHYSSIWNNVPVVKYFGKGPIEKLPSGFCILEFPPTQNQNMWTYATCCMSKMDDVQPIELHMYSPKQSPEPLELLTAITDYHVIGKKLNLNHTVNFGKDPICTYGLISLPYLDGVKLENLQVEDKVAKFYWLIPITEKERDFKIKNGIEALEKKFEATQFNYADNHRKSVV